MNVYDNDPLMICVTRCICRCVLASSDDHAPPYFASRCAVFVIECSTDKMDFNWASRYADSVCLHLLFLEQEIECVDVCVKHVRRRAIYIATQFELLSPWNNTASCLLWCLPCFEWSFWCASTRCKNAPFARECIACVGRYMDTLSLSGLPEWDRVRARSCS
jgi:hypothetical protein